MCKCRWETPYTCGMLVRTVAMLNRHRVYGGRLRRQLVQVLHGESRASAATPRNQNNSQPSRGQPQDV